MWYFRYIKKKLIVFISIFTLVFTIGTNALADDLDEIREILKEGYYKPVNQQIIEKGSIDEILAALGDPYTEFFTKQEFDDFKKSIDMNYVGIGIIGEQHEMGVKVDYLFETGAAIQSNLQVEDIIIEVNGTSLEGKTIGESQTFLLGNPGTRAELKVFRSSTNETLMINITRAKTELAPTVESAWLGGNIGYIRLNSFNEDLISEVKEAMQDLEGVEGWIVDLRDNGGGYLDAAQDAAGFFPDLEVAIIVEGKNLEPVAYLAKKQTPQFMKPVIMLINSESASAAEILAAAVKDQDGAKLYGQTTFGKGIAQTVFKLSSGNMFKMTVAEFYSPEGTIIHEVGVAPHLETEIGGELPIAHRDLLLWAEDEDVHSDRIIEVLPRTADFILHVSQAIAPDEIEDRVSLIELGGATEDVNLVPLSFTAYRIEPKEPLKSNSKYLLKIDSDTKDYVLEFKTSDQLGETKKVVNFVDVRDLDFYANAVAVLEKEGIVNGIGDRRFGADTFVTREQAAVFFARVLDLDTTSVVGSHFKDVKPSDYFYSSVAAVRKAGVMSGKSSERFGTGDILTRGEISALLARAFSLQKQVGGQDIPFTDADDSPFIEDIQKVYENGIASGTTATTFSPKKAVTRGELSVFLYRALMNQNSGNELIIESIER